LPDLSDSFVIAMPRQVWVGNDREWRKTEWQKTATERPTLIEFCAQPVTTQHIKVILRIIKSFTKADNTKCRGYEP
jgi:hypothetical protein